MATILAAGCAMLLVACAPFFQPLEKPVLNIIDFRVMEARLLEQRYCLVFRVQNPNSIDLPVTGVHYALRLEGEDFANGVNSKPFRVPAYGEAQFEVEVTTTLFRIIQRLADYMSQQPREINYEIRGRIRVDKAFIGDLPFDAKGKIEIPRPPARQ